MRIHLALALIVSSTLVIIGCGGGDSSTPPAQSLSITISPSSVTLIAAATQQFTAVVRGSSNTAVAWSLSSSGCSGTACGTITPTGLYTAPTPVSASMIVNVIATAMADSSKSATAAANLMPMSVSISPASVSVYQRDMTKFTASVDGDPSASVTWDVDGLIGGGCSTGYIWPSGMYTTAYCDIYNAPQTFIITARSNADSTKFATAQVTVTGAAPNNSKMDGDYALLYRGWDKDGPVALSGHFHADGTGGIIGGELALNSKSNTILMSGSGNYSIGNDNRGTMYLGSWIFRFVVDSTGKMRLINFDETLNNPIRGSGEIKLQDSSAFSLSAFHGPFVMSFNGDLSGTAMALLGQFTFDSTGALNGSVSSISPTVIATYTMTGTLSDPDPLTGHGLATFTPVGLPMVTPLMFDYFIVSPTEAFLVQRTSRSANVPVLSGAILKQSGGPFTNASMNTPAVFQLTGPTSGGSHAILAQASFDGNGFLAGVTDDNRAGAVTANMSFNGTYTVNGSGYGTANLVLSPGDSTSFTFYLVSPGKAYIAGGVSGMPVGEVVTGMLEPQTGRPFTQASLAGSYAMGSLSPATSFVSDAVASVAVTATGGLDGMQDVWTVNGIYLGEPWDGAISITDAISGRGSITPCSLMCGPAPFFVVSPTKLLQMEWAAGNDARIQVYEK